VVGIVETEEPLTLGINPGSAASRCNLAQWFATLSLVFAQPHAPIPSARSSPPSAPAVKRPARNANATACTPVNGACQVVGATTSVLFLREYAYPLLNDSIPVPTAFVPFP